jgi:hypothetical protein
MNILRTTISEDMYEVNVAMLLKMFEFSSLLISKSNFHFDFKGIRALTIDKDNAPKVLSHSFYMNLSSFEYSCMVLCIYMYQNDR